ncbi:head GIN domain-containing protein [Muriicola soli]|uniref:DUF2807 domain-containing protein n=1 Tax=Muriicola soli TaxID=2507538 RepID=A0A411E8I2_9FLAO|nr:head GIN domain-containing protein [Muriicola soli]QBA63770.1 DUF2807 domain-containing protein [Muriicola soli]
MKKVQILCMMLIFANISCAQWGKKVKGNGEVVTIERITGDYEGVSVGGWFDVELVSGKEGSVSIKGEENLLEYIITEVKDGRLVVKVEKGINLQPSSWKSGGISVTIPVEEINYLSMSGSGDLEGRTVLKSSDFKTRMSGSGDMEVELEVENLEVTVSGSGDMNLSGNTDTLEVQISGSGDVHAYELEANHVSATVSGSANIRVTARESLKARVSGSGDISYRGNPEKIDSKTSGSGDISKG